MAALVSPLEKATTMTKEQARLIRFALQYTRDGQWESYGKDVRATVRTLARHGILELSPHLSTIQTRTQEAPAMNTQESYTPKTTAEIEAAVDGKLAAIGISVDALYVGETKREQHGGKAMAVRPVDGEL